MVSTAMPWIGTSGWHYKHWRGPFYPESMSPKDFFPFYVRYFSTVELNNSFYGLPKPETFQQWRETSPEGFLFAVKANRYITHMKKLKDTQEALTDFLERASGLKEKLGPILFQLPPSWRLNLDRLKSFLGDLPQEHRYTFEFRNETWFDPRVYGLLRDRNVAFCIYDLNRKTSPLPATADFVYIRLHGPGGPYQGRYDLNALQDWANHIREWLSQGRDVFCYFDNDPHGYAVQNARELIEMVTG